MRFRTIAESRERARALGLEAVEGEPWFSLPTGASTLSFSIEEMPNAKIALARVLVSWLGEFNDCEFWVSEFGTWPSSEDWNLYQRLRGSYGDSVELYDAPAHFFDGSERVELETYLNLAIHFGWGGHVIPAPLRTYFFLSHDGWVIVASTEFHSKIKKDLRDWKIDFEVL